MYHLGEAHAVLKQWEQALFCLTKAAQLQLNLPNIQGKISLAINNISQGNEENLDMTIESYIRLIKLNPYQSSFFYLNLIGYLMPQQKFDLAVEAIIRASEIHPEQIDLFHTCLDQILDTKGHRLESLLNLARILEKNGETGRAVVVCKNGLELFPNNTELKKCRLFMGFRELAK